jgi:hypothetical protein
VFLTPLEVRLLNDRTEYPWLTLSELVYESELTGETYTVPRYFRTDGASVPSALVALPVVGFLLFKRYFGSGVWLGFRAGVLHDSLLRSGEVPKHLAHKIFREALYSEGYPEDLIETYYAAVVDYSKLKD